MNKLTPEEFFGDEMTRTKAIAQARRIGGTHIVRFEVLDMCSSRFGESTCVVIGPECTIPDLEQAGKTSLDVDLSSTIKWPVAYIEVNQGLSND